MAHDEEDDSVGAMQAFAADLGLKVDRSVAARALEAARELESSVETLAEAAERDPANSSVGTPSDDEYGALLDVYETPRRAAEDGPLADLSFAVKDVIAADGLEMTLGLRDHSYVPSFDAVVVERLLAAGASLVGKANTDALAMGPTGEFSERGEVRNPAAPDRVPGGSSSGPAAAVAGGLVDAALGTDTGGSVRIPAACCGVVGVKPTHGIVPQYGVQELAPSADTVGPIARDVATAVRVLEAIVGSDVRDPTTRATVPDSIRSAFENRDPISVGLPTPFFDGVDDVVSDVVRDAAERIDDGTVEVTDVAINLGEIRNAHPLLTSPEFAWLLRQSFAVRGHGRQYEPEMYRASQDLSFNDHIALRRLPGAYVGERTDGEAYVLGRREVIRFERRLHEVFDGVDALVMPTLMGLPPRRGRIEASHEGIRRMTGNTGPFSRVGFPAVSVPAGEHDGIPVGTQVVAPPNRDGTALRVAALLEA